MEARATQVKFASALKGGDDSTSAIGSQIDLPAPSLARHARSGKALT